MKLLRHDWESTGFQWSKCTKCGCEKQHIKGRLTFYFRSGVQLAGLPGCKSIIHSDKTL